LLHVKKNSVVTRPVVVTCYIRFSCIHDNNLWSHCWCLHV